jgi:hypothetical protein
MIRFRHNWTSKLAANWNEFCAPLFPDFPERRPINWLEIGVFEGRTAQWVLDNVLTTPGDSYRGIDPWELQAMDPIKWPRDGRGQEQISAVEATARSLLEPYNKDARPGVPFRVRLIKGRSADVLRSDPDYWVDGEWDVVYIDGLHTPLGIMSDAVLTWPLLKIGGIMIFDDYVVRRRFVRRQIQRTVGDFLAAVAGAHRVLFVNSQVGVQKLAEGYQVAW